MSTPTVPPCPTILDIDPYVSGDFKIGGVDRIIKLSSNEGAFGPSPRAVAAMQQAATTAHRYPDGGASELRGAIAKRFGLDPERIVCGAGSDELLSLLTYSYAGPGDEVLYTEHGFLIYPIAARAAGATPVKAPETNLRTDVGAVLNAVTRRTRIVFIANPNNPTGTYLSHAELTALRVGLPGDVLLVIDAAYAEFVDKNNYSPGIELVDAGQNTVMTRTFSKLFGLGGMRVGWGYFPTQIADVLNRVRGPFNVSAPAQAAAIASLEDLDFQAKCFEHNQIWRDKTETALNAHGIATTASVGNFVLARFGDAQTAANADAFLRQRGIIVRRVAGYGLPDCLRISIGPGADMTAFITAIEDFTKNTPGA